jgi:glycosyltransferase involved in cell wall biosynthesis
MEFEFNKKTIIRRKKNICMICANTLLNDARVLKTAETIRKAGYRLTLFGLQSTPSNLMEEKVLGYNFEIIRLQNPAWTLKKQKKWNMDYRDYESFTNIFASSIAEIFKRSKFDALYTHDMYGIAIGGKLKKIKQIKLIPWIHDVHEYVAGLTELDTNLRNYVEEEEKKYIRDVDRITCVSPILKEKLQNNYDVKNIEIILNCPRIGDYDSSFIDVKNDCNLGKEIKLISYHGNVKKIRGVSKLIEAISKLPKNYHGVIISNSAGEYVENLKCLASEIADNRIHFKPYVPNHKVSSYIRTSHASVHPIESYPNSELALPNKIFESLHANVPFICSPLEAMAKFTKTYKTGIVADDGTVDSLVKSVLSIESDASNEFNFDIKTKEKYSWEYFEKVIIEKIIDPLFLISSLNSINDSKTVRDISICQLPNKSAGQPNALAQSLKIRGLSACSIAIKSSNKFSYFSDMTLDDEEFLKEANSGEEQLKRLFDFMWVNPCIQNKDIYHFHANSLLYSKFLEYPYVLGDVAVLRSQGSRTFFHFRGSECRLESIFNKLNPYSWIDEVNSLKDGSLEKKELIKQLPYRFNEQSQIKYISRANSYSTEVFITDPEVGVYVPNATIIPRVVDPSLFEKGSKRTARANISKKEEFVIAHAPSRPFIKGTPFVLKVVEQLKANGFNIKLDLIQGISHSDALERYQKADLVIDQLRIGWYGVLSVEAMALGIPVVCYIRDDLMHYLPRPRPLINANLDNLYEVLRAAIESPDELNKVGIRGYKYAFNMHNTVTVSEILEQIYKDPWESFKNSQQLSEIASLFAYFSSKTNFNDVPSTISLVDSIKDENNVSTKHNYLQIALKADSKNSFTTAIKFYRKALKLYPLGSLQAKYITLRLKYLNRILIVV